MKVDLSGKLARFRSTEISQLGIGSEKSQSVLRSLASRERERERYALVAGDTS